MNLANAQHALAGIIAAESCRECLECAHCRRLVLAVHCDAHISACPGKPAPEIRMDVSRVRLRSSKRVRERPTRDKAATKPAPPKRTKKQHCSSKAAKPCGTNDNSVIAESLQRLVLY